MTAALSDLPFLNLLLFQAAGVSFAADLEQIARMRDLAEEPDRAELHWFHEEIGMESVEPAQYGAPTVLTLRSDAAAPFRIVVDAMEDIVEVPIGDIQPFPPLVAGRALENGLWGVIPRNGIMILLVDLERLAHGNRCATRREG
ncbi:CheW domain-containing protein [Geomesophilobacter sediminis]|uniref:CheW-like domain-containing protein n=1 Tax=Geomesophilobacter sediminis TaxID=2798584 RepID=A0A8J7S7N9_9BACT|nr:hypothetical protein [Geomesophilobacter sediminis]MBJ6727136.1 hypothetical protein [Geomesophilobacter sediminis]